jgi:hypothetical protein
MLDIFFVLIKLTVAAAVTDPVVTSWYKTTGYSSGYSCFNNVWKISYSDSYTYVYANGIPNYTIGPWNSNPNQAICQDFTFKVLQF